MFRNNKGFTLVEVLLAIPIFILSLMIFSHLITYLNHSSHYVDYETFQFFHFIEDELRQSYRQEIKDNKIFFHKDSGDVVLFEQYNHQIRRRVNQTGHEVLLNNIKMLEVKRRHGYIYTTITKTNEAVIEKVFNPLKE